MKSKSDSAFTEEGMWLRHTTHERRECFSNSSTTTYGDCFCVWLDYKLAQALDSGVTRGQGRHLSTGTALWGRQIEVGMLRTNYEMSNLSRC